MSKDIVVAEGLTKKYNRKKVVKGISFSVKEGEIFGILLTKRRWQNNDTGDA